MEERRPAFIQRLLARLPGSRALWIGSFTLLPIAAAFMPDAFVATVGEASLGRRLVAGVVFAYAVLVSLIAVAYFERKIYEVEESLDDRGLFIEYSSATGPLLLATVFTIATTVRTMGLTDLETALTWAPVSFLVNVPLMSGFYVYLVLLLGLDRVGRRRLSMSLFPEDPSLGLFSVGHLAYMAFWIFTAASVPILVVNYGDGLRLVLSLLIFLAGVAIFFASIWRLHLQLTAARRDALAEARSLLAGAYEPVRSGSQEALERQSQAILAAKAIEEEARSIQRWPFDDRRFRQIAALVGTIVTFTGTGIVTRLIYEEVIF